MWKTKRHSIFQSCIIHVFWIFFACLLVKEVNIFLPLKSASCLFIVHIKNTSAQNDIEKLSIYISEETTTVVLYKYFPGNFFPVLRNGISFPRSTIFSQKRGCFCYANKTVSIIYCFVFIFLLIKGRLYFVIQYFSSNMLLWCVPYI